jgi:hypothetical protein
MDGNDSDVPGRLARATTGGLPSWAAVLELSVYMTPLTWPRTSFSIKTSPQVPESPQSTQLLLLDFRLDIEKDLKANLVRYRKRIEENKIATSKELSKHGQQD